MQRVELSTPCETIGSKMRGARRADWRFDSGSDKPGRPEVDVRVDIIHGDAGGKQSQHESDKLDTRLKEQMPQSSALLSWPQRYKSQ